MLSDVKNKLYSEFYISSLEFSTSVKS